MSWLDLLIIGFFLALGYRGFSEGFVLQFGKIGGPILGLLLAFMTYERWGATLSLYLNVPQALTGAGAFLLVSVGVTVGVGLLARWMQSSVQQARFGLCDRLLRCSGFFVPSSSPAVSWPLSLVQICIPWRN